MGEINMYNVLVRKSEGKRPLVRPDIDRIILERILET
jgi:hypothetical protein